MYFMYCDLSTGKLVQNHQSLDVVAINVICVMLGTVTVLISYTEEKKGLSLLLLLAGHPCKRGKMHAENMVRCMGLYVFLNSG